MKHTLWATGSKIALLGLALMLAFCAPTMIAAQTIPPTPSASTVSDADGAKMTMEQTLSDQAQQTTIAFDGLAFLTGSLGADSFFPPGKVVDYWGFQYLRDNDPSEMGHNTDFLTKASLNMLSILTTSQRRISYTRQQSGQLDQRVCVQTIRADQSISPLARWRYSIGHNGSRQNGSDEILGGTVSARRANELRPRQVQICFHSSIRRRIGQ